MQITRGRIPCGQKVVIYGVPGIGKTTLAAQFPNAVFIDTEGSTRNFDVARFPVPSSWEMLKNEVQYAVDNPSELGTLVIDTADWAAKQCNVSVAQRVGKQGIEDFDYGKGYTYAAEEYGRLLDLLDRLTSKGVHVVLTAHSVLKHVEQPDQFGKYDQWSLKCDPKISALTMEWADMILFCNYKVMVISTDNKGQKGKGQGGQRIMYAATRPAFVAKNRHGLPDEMPMEYGRIAHIFGTGSAMQSQSVPSSQATMVPEFAPDVSAAQMPEANPTPADTSEVRAAPATEPPTPAPAAFTQEAESPFTLANSLDEIYPPLADLLRENGVTPMEIQIVVGDKGYFPTDMPVKNYPTDFVEGCLVAAWPSVYECVLKDREELPF